jgi:hypothetical protein
MPSAKRSDSDGAPKLYPGAVRPTRPNTGAARWNPGEVSAKRGNKGQPVCQGWAVTLLATAKESGNAHLAPPPRRALASSTRWRCSTSGVALTKALRAEAVRWRRNGRGGPVSPSSFRAGPRSGETVFERPRRLLSEDRPPNQLERVTTSEGEGLPGERYVSRAGMVASQ